MKSLNKKTNKSTCLVVGACLAGLMVSGCGGGGGSTDKAVTVSPADGEVDVSRGTAISAAFKEDMLPGSFTASTFTLNDDVGDVPGSVSFNDVSNTAVLTPSSTLAVNREFSANLTNGVTDLGGNPITTMTWSFTTADASWNPQSKIESDDVNNASYPQLDFDANGNAVAVWFQQNKVWGNYYDNTNGVWGAAQEIGTNVGVAHLQVAMAEDGDAVAVWSQNISGVQVIYTSRYTPNSGWDPDEAIGASKNNAWNPQIGIDNAGNIMVVWAEDDGLGNYDIWANYLADGDAWDTADSVLIESGAGNAEAPHLFANGGTFIATWIQHDNGFDHVWVNRYASNAWEGAQQIDSEAADAVTPQVVIDGNGNAIVVWEQAFDSYDSIWASRYSANDTWAAAAVIEAEIFNASDPQIAMDYAGNALAVWVRNGNLYSANYADGVGWGAETSVEENTGTVGFPQLAVDATGNAVAIWRQKSSDVNSAWVNRYQKGSGWGTAELAETDDIQATVSADIDVDADGRGFAIWVQNDGSANSVWVKRFD